MNEVTRSSRVITALQVIQRTNEGLSVKEACSAVGMPRSTYYSILARETETIAEFQNMVVANSRENLWMILASQTMILQKIIDEGLADSTKPRVRLAIYKALAEKLDQLAQDLQLNRQDNALASDILKGPVLRPGMSRFTAGSPDEVIV